MQTCVVVLENKMKIMDFMNETYDYRKLQIKKCLHSPTAIVMEYPRFKDFDYGKLVNGKLVSGKKFKALYMFHVRNAVLYLQIIADFMHQYPSVSDLSNFMSKYSKRIERLAHYRNVEFGESTDG